MKFSSQFITALCRFGQYSRLLLNKPMRVFWYFIIICALCFCIKCGAFFHGYAIMNPDDKAGLEAALRIKDQNGAKVTVLTMGLPKADAVLREAMAMGADDAILVTDRVLGGSGDGISVYDSSSWQYLVPCLS